MSGSYFICLNSPRTCWEVFWLRSGPVRDTLEERRHNSQNLNFVKYDGRGWGLKSTKKYDVIIMWTVPYLYRFSVTVLTRTVRCFWMFLSFLDRCKNFENTKIFHRWKKFKNFLVAEMFFLKIFRFENFNWNPTFLTFRKFSEKVGFQLKFSIRKKIKRNFSATKTFLNFFHRWNIF